MSDICLGDVTQRKDPVFVAIAFGNLQDRKKALAHLFRRYRCGIAHSGCPGYRRCNLYRRPHTFDPLGSHQKDKYLAAIDKKNVKSWPQNVWNRWNNSTNIPKSWRFRVENGAEYAYGTRKSAPILRKQTKPLPNASALESR